MSGLEGDKHWCSLEIDLDNSASSEGSLWDSSTDLLANRPMGDSGRLYHGVVPEPSMSSKPVEAFKQRLPSDLGAGHGQHANLLVGLARVYFHLTEKKVELRSSVEKNERRPVALADAPFDSGVGHHYFNQFCFLVVGSPGCRHFHVTNVAVKVEVAHAGNWRGGIQGTTETRYYLRNYRRTETTNRGVGKLPPDSAHQEESPVVLYSKLKDELKTNRGRRHSETCSADRHTINGMRRGRKTCSAGARPQSMAVDYLGSKTEAGPCSIRGRVIGAMVCIFARMWVLVGLFEKSSAQNQIYGKRMEDLWCFRASATYKDYIPLARHTPGGRGKPVLGIRGSFQSIRHCYQTRHAICYVVYLTDTRNDTRELDAEKVTWIRRRSRFRRLPRYASVQFRVSAPFAIAISECECDIRARARAADDCETRIGRGVCRVEGADLKNTADRMRTRRQMNSDPTAMERWSGAVITEKGSLWVSRGCRVVVTEEDVGGRGAKMREQPPTARLCVPGLDGITKKMG
ncbi:hypothetical protein DFH08DRAFT_1019872 [Mycena albidolilacea]|uniref:Uncharacterized protein n=1 Tax=Mycena albidolilacea TaxID=1033008 RepID=A0AAD6ZQ13_9AGAR|nr:hypothetical protein DFH08DRAFT_1019872 [Mycena albidolilacea]